MPEPSAGRPLPRLKGIPLVLLGALASAACASASPSRGEPAPSAAYDVVISGGRIVDGSGNAWFHGDVGIRGDRVARITPPGMLARAAARERVDARGMVVSPGFWDIQSHSRGALLDGDSRVVGKVTQGVTTEIMGEGSTNAPANERTVAGAASADPSPQQSPRFTGPRAFDQWLTAMETRGTSVNVGSFLGATTVRMYAKGMAQGAATPAELDTMRAVVRNAMEDGAFGIATALIYPPGTFASTGELTELAKAMSPYGGVYITHMRSEADAFLEAIDEALAIGREGGVAVEIYHLKAAGRRNWPKAAQAIAKIDSARAAGQDVSADMYPYEAGGTGLSACLPPWAAADGKLLENLRDPATRARIRDEVARERTEWENLCQLATPEGVRVSGFRTDSLRVHNGKSLAEIAAARGEHWIDALIALTLGEQGRLGAMYFIASEENLALQMRQPWMKFGTDASGLDPDSVRSLVHPRSYGVFPRILGRYVREQRVMPLEEAVRKMSSAVASRLRVADRGVLREGAFADVVIFDPATIADRATYDRPHQLSVGVRDVWVNGQRVLRDGRHTGAKPGRVVRGPGWTGAAR